MFPDRFKVDGKVAVVTGAGRGIGAASAAALAEAGADVVLAARTSRPARRRGAAVEAAAAGARRTGRPDPTWKSWPTSPIGRTRKFGRLDIVSTTSAARSQPLLDTDAGFLEEAFHFNVLTAHALTGPRFR